MLESRRVSSSQNIGTFAFGHSSRRVRGIKIGCSPRDEAVQSHLECQLPKSVQHRPRHSTSVQTTKRENYEHILKHVSFRACPRDRTSVTRIMSVEESTNSESYNQTDLFAEGLRNRKAPHHPSRISNPPVSHVDTHRSKWRMVGKWVRGPGPLKRFSSGDSRAVSVFVWNAGSIKLSSRLRSCSSVSVRASTVELSAWRKSWVVSISFAIPAVHSRTWGRMYLMKADELHLPKIIILATEQSARKRDMAAPERMECVPISIGLYPKDA